MLFCIHLLLGLTLCLYLEIGLARGDPLSILALGLHYHSAGAWLELELFIMTLLTKSAPLPSPAISFLKGSFMLLIFQPAPEKGTIVQVDLWKKTPIRKQEELAKSA